MICHSLGFTYFFPITDRKECQAIQASSLKKTFTNNPLFREKAAIRFQVSLFTIEINDKGRGVKSEIVFGESFGKRVDNIQATVRSKESSIMWNQVTSTKA